MISGFETGKKKMDFTCVKQEEISSLGTKMADKNKLVWKSYRWRRASGEDVARN
jgi:hypothetical protein